MMTHIAYYTGPQERESTRKVHDTESIRIMNSSYTD